MNKTRRYTVQVTKTLTIFATGDAEAISFAEVLTGPEMGEQVMMEIVGGPETLTDEEEMDLQSLAAEIAEGELLDMDFSH